MFDISFHTKKKSVENENTGGTTITWAQYCEEGIWVTQQGTGALLLVRPGSNKILKYGPVPGAWVDDITTLKFMYVLSFVW